MKHSTGKPTKAEADRMGRLKEMRCAVISCIQGPCDVHHLLSGNRRRGHMFTIPLCAWHHRGVPLGGLRLDTLEALLGPSLALTSKKFHERYGTDDELLESTNAALLRTGAIRC